MNSYMTCQKFKIGDIVEYYEGITPVLGSISSATFIDNWFWIKRCDGKGENLRAIYDILPVIFYL